MKKIKIFIIFSLIFWIFSCSENFDKEKFQKVENENYSYIIPKEWSFEEWRFSKIIETKISENEKISIKVINKNQTWATYEEFETLHKNKKWLTSEENLKIDWIDSKKFLYSSENSENISEVVLFEKWDFLYKMEIYYLKNSQNKEKIYEIFKNLKIKS